MVEKNSKLVQTDWFILFSILTLLITSTVVLRSLAPFLYPNYFLYIALAIIFLYFFLRIDFEIFSIFSPHLYIASIVLLVLTLLIGQITRGSVRWIPIGQFSFQPSEIVRPFLILYFSHFIFSFKLDVKRLVKAAILFILPISIILAQPSLGVAILTAMGFFGVLMASTLNKKHLLALVLLVLLSIPFAWFALQPYQKQRVTSFLDPSKDPQGAGYSSIQAMISVGSGGSFGRGLGEGAQTQLAFLPEKHTDFIFAAIAEELGFAGSLLVLFALLVIYLRTLRILDNSLNPVARGYVSGIFLILLAETFIHLGMNMGLLPITGVPLPFVSAGGSSLVGSAMSIALVIKARKPLA